MRNFSNADMRIEKPINVIKGKEDKGGKFLKTITGADEKYHEKAANELLFLSKEQVETYVEIDNKIKPQDLVYAKQNFNRHGTVIIFISNFGDTGY